MRAPLVLAGAAAVLVGALLLHGARPLQAAGLQTPPAATAPTSAGDVLPFRASEHTLPNGLRVIVVPTGFPNLVSIEIPVQTGSRNEVEPGKSGFAHFFEHLMFRGTPNVSPAQYRDIMTRAGSRDNASTGDDYTHFYATFAKDDLDTVLGVYADMFQHLAYSEPDFKTEARAVLGEYNKNSAEPLRKLLEIQRDRFYQTHTYKHTTMGFIGDIENMPSEYEYSKVFFERWYRPEYTTVIVAGDVSDAAVMASIEKHWGAWKAGTAPPPVIPTEPPPSGPKYVHVPWESETLPYIAVAFPKPAFNENDRNAAAFEMIDALYFGETSELYRQLVVQQQKVDALYADVPRSVDPSLFTVIARVKDAADAVYVRDRILATAALARRDAPAARRLADAKSHARYAFARSLDSTERIAAVVSSFAKYRRSFATGNAYYRTLDNLSPDDVRKAAESSFTDKGLIVTTLAHGALAPAVQQAPPLASFAAEPALPTTASRPVAVPLATPAASTAPRTAPVVLQKSVLPQLNVKLLFAIGSAVDPPGKEGLAALTAAMIANAGSRSLTVEQISEALYPMAGAFVASVDKEMTVFTAQIHRERWQDFLPIALPQLTAPGFRDDDFRRVKAAQLNALVQDLRSNNEEELGKERLQTDIFAGTPYGHVALGTIAGINAITLDDVRGFARRMYTRANLTIGAAGDVPDAMLQVLQTSLAALPAGTPTPRVRVDPRKTTGRSAEIVAKDTRATAISLGFPIDVTRAHPDFAALSVARAWLGDHRSSSGRLFQRIREVRGMNYGDYAYIEAFPRGMFQFFPDPNIVRQRQIFEIWIRPVVPENGHMALRIATRELEELVANGMTKDAFEATRNYLMKNVYVMTARQDAQLGYALDSRWYGIGEFTSAMRDALGRLTLDQVNAAIRRHLTPDRLTIVVITKDAAAFEKALVSDAPSPIHYDGEKPADLLAEDRIIGGLPLHLAPERVSVTPIADVFAR